MDARPEPTTDALAQRAPDRAGGDVAPVPSGMERWISLVLRGGVLLSGAIVGLGLALFLLMQPAPGEPSAVSALLATEFHPTSLGAILGGTFDARPTALIRLGVILLIVTPLARVALTWLLFVEQRDWRFVAITSIVVLVLLLGLLGRLG